MRRADSTPTTLVERCRLLALRMPDAAFFSHSTAALLMGTPLPLSLERSGVTHVSVPAPARAPHASGIAGHSLVLDSRSLARTHGLGHTSPARTWCDLATQLSLHDLVAAGDFFVHHRLPLTTIAQLAAEARRIERRRGAATIRAALPLLSTRAESRPESILRVILALGGLPSPRINYEIVDAEDGTYVRTDFAFGGAKLILEYQGDYHRTRSQWRKDMTRRSRLEADGWYVMELNADDLQDAAELVERIRGVLHRRGSQR